MYGCEATHVSESVLESFNVQAMRAIYGDAIRRSRDCMYNLSDIDFDAEAEICMRRVVLLRRMLSKNCWLIDHVSGVISMYLDRGFPGTVPNHWEGPIAISPPVGSPNRSAWKK